MIQHGVGFLAMDTVINLESMVRALTIVLVDVNIRWHFMTAHYESFGCLVVMVSAMIAEALVREDGCCT